jgi:hypothetical protein
VADRVQLFQVTCAANTPQSAATETLCYFNPGNVIHIEVLVPAGHAGLTGLALAQSHQIVIPYSGATWLISDAETIGFDWTDTLQNGAWSMFTYNTDTLLSHSWFLRFFVNELGSATAAATPTNTTPEQIPSTEIETSLNAAEVPEASPPEAPTAEESP